MKKREFLIKQKRMILYVMAAIIIITAMTLFICNALVVSNAERKIFTETNDIPATEVGLLLGTTPQTRIGRRQNLFFKYRIDAAEVLYKTGKIKYLLVSGDENSLDGINETQHMKDSLIARGIPANVIFTDGKGFRTLDSVVRTNKIFGIKSFTIISQKFHNERALYLAGHMCEDIDKVIAFNAKSPTSNMAVITYLREYFARVKMFIDIITDKKPMVMGEKQNLGI